MCWHRPPSGSQWLVWLGPRDEQRSVLNVPPRLTRLSVRMIPGLISPTDWICSLGERFRLPASNPNPPPPFSLQCGSIYSNMISGCQALWTCAPMKAVCLRQGGSKLHHTLREHLRLSQVCVCPTVWTCCHALATRDKLETFLTGISGALTSQLSKLPSDPACH